MDITQIMMAVLGGGFGVVLINRMFGRRADVNDLLRNTIKDLQALHLEEIVRLRDQISLLEGKVDLLRGLLNKYEERSLRALDDIKKKLK